ncbi:zinc-binding dehydrogenase [Motiliproteus sp. SC1-56]|uniref:zinc-binding dehydrogenase n=1 Tax=Motiliproteus sp. SC1-56 TaxID=2799565 RepID=UPI001A8F3121|nr:zinc-binding dehydrogenase [Motiliproteus sp. SC1-56]
MGKMHAITMQDGKINLDDIDIPQPGPGQVLVKSLACGICGSDLHLTRHTSDVFSVYKQLGLMDPGVEGTPGIMLGHEFAAEVVSYGPQTEGKFPPGTRVTGVPVLQSAGGAGVGVTPGLYGAYSEYFIADEALLIPIPEHVSSHAAATCEPLAVGLHSVNRSAVGVDDIALVAGCGTIGLAVMAALSIRGVKTILASDPQASKHAIAKAFGATRVVDPTQEDEVALAAELAGDNNVVIYECVGVYKLINGFIERAPKRAKLIITGVHTTPFEVNFAIPMVKEMDIRFSYYYTPEEFAECLQYIADGKVNWRAMCTGKVGIDGVSGAFDTLLKPNDHIKVIIEPWRKGALTAYSDEGG